jgi:lipoyl-dependent peroxiredoxin
MREGSDQLAQQEALMAIAIRMAQATWEGPLASGTGLIRMDSGATGELPVTWASRTERADGRTSPEELAAAHSACYALALRLGEHEAVPGRLAVDATVTLDEAAASLPSSRHTSP